MKYLSPTVKTHIDTVTGYPRLSVASLCGKHSNWAISPGAKGHHLIRAHCLVNYVRQKQWSDDELCN